MSQLELHDQDEGDAEAAEMLRGVPALPPEMSRIDALRWVLEHHQCALVEGVAVDVQSANAIVTVYDNLSEKNKPKFLAMPIGKMGDVAWQVIAKVQRG